MGVSGAPFDSAIQAVGAGEYVMPPLPHEIAVVDASQLVYGVCAGQRGEDFVAGLVGRVTAWFACLRLLIFVWDGVGPAPRRNTHDERKYPPDGDLSLVSFTDACLDFGPYVVQNLPRNVMRQLRDYICDALERVVRPHLPESLALVVHRPDGTIVEIGAACVRVPTAEELNFKYGEGEARMMDWLKSLQDRRPALVSTDGDLAMMLALARGIVADIVKATSVDAEAGPDGTLVRATSRKRKAGDPKRGSAVFLLKAEALQRISYETVAMLGNTGTDYAKPIGAVTLPALAEGPADARFVDVHADAAGVTVRIDVGAYIAWLRRAGQGRSRGILRNEKTLDVARLETSIFNAAWQFLLWFAVARGLPIPAHEPFGYGADGRRALVANRIHTHPLQTGTMRKDGGRTTWGPGHTHSRLFESGCPLPTTVIEYTWPG